MKKGFIIGGIILAMAGLFLVVGIKIYESQRIFPNDYETNRQKVKSLRNIIIKKVKAIF